MSWPPSHRIRVNPLRETLTFVDNIVDSTTGTIHQRNVRKSEESTLAGFVCQYFAYFSQQPNATIVPAHSIVSTQDGSYVYVVRANNTVEQRTVVPNRTVDDETVVDKGVQPGETIVTDGQVDLIPGAKIEIKNLNGGSSVDKPAGRADQQADAADPPARKSSPSKAQ